MTASVTSVLVVSDTHLGHGQGGRLTDELSNRSTVADLVLHAGDITDPSVLEALAGIAPVRAVRGNNDHGMADLPERCEFEIAGCRIAMIHDSGSSVGRAGRLRCLFPDADLVVFGHSHLPWHETDERDDGQIQHHLNPGSAIQRRQAPTRTIAWVEIAEGVIADVRHESLGT